MAATLEVGRLLSARSRANLLHRPVTGAGSAAVAEVVRRVAGLQAQSWSGAALAVRARSTATLWSDVENARVQDRSVLRGWFMRGTLQLVATEDAGWLLGVLAPVVLAGTERRYGELGVDASTRKKSVGVLEAELTARGPLDRAEIGETLVRAGLLTEPRGQALYALIHHAGIHGVLCYGPDRSGAETWVAVRDWLGAPLPVPAALADPAAAATELARRYLAAYAPASPHDFATWSGLRVSLARKAFRSLPGLVEVKVGDDTLAALDQPAAHEPVGVRLLGPFDPYLLGYRSRDLAVESAYRKRINAGGGMISPAVLDDGHVIGTWRPDRRKGATDIELFGNKSDPRLNSEITDVDRFYD